jgi:diketogulonate reductase-like aldo/keto reductase
MAHVLDGKSILKEVWHGMEEVKRAGLAVSIGVSDLSVKEICEVRLFFLL